MAVLPTMEVPAGWPRRLATVWFTVLVAGFLIYSTFSILQASQRWKQPTSIVEYVAADFPLPTISLCVMDLFEYQSLNSPLDGITASCWDARNPTSPMARDFDVSNYPLQERRLNETVTVRFASLPGDCEATPVYELLEPYPGWRRFNVTKGKRLYEVCVQFNTEKLPGLAQSLTNQPVLSPVIGIVRLTMSTLWAGNLTYSGFHLKSSAPAGFFGSTKPSVYRAAVNIAGNSQQQATPTFSVKTYLNGTKIVQQAWEISSTPSFPNIEYTGQFSANSVDYQLMLFPNALGVLNIKERSSVNVPVLLSQFASAWSAVILLFGLLFSRQEIREFVLEQRFASFFNRQEVQGNLDGREKVPPQDLYPAA